MNNLIKKYIIAIDGGAGTGKSTVSNELAKRLNIVHIDTGALYRAATVYFIENGIEPTEENIDKNLDNINITLKNENNMLRVILNEIDVTDKIRTEKVSNIVPIVAKYQPLRDRIVIIQRNIANSQSAVIDGRDIGTVVFPNADLKIYLTASLEKRAERRKSDLEKAKEKIDINTTKADLEKRDMLDTTRKNSPLKKAEDAKEVDTTNNTVEESADIIINMLKEERNNIMKKIIKGILKGFIKIFLCNFFYKVKYHGLENLNELEKCIICPNHSNKVEPAWIFSKTNDLCIMAKNEIFEKKFWNYLFTYFDVFPIRRGEHDVKSLIHAINLFKNVKKRKLLIFPEGERLSKDIERLPAKVGPAYIAYKAKVPMVPVYITKNAKVFSKVDIIIGKPIYINEKIGKDKEKIHEIINKMMDEIYTYPDKLNEKI